MHTYGTISQNAADNGSRPNIHHLANSRLVSVVTSFAAAAVVFGVVSTRPRTMNAIAASPQQLDELPFGETESEALLEDANADSAMELRAYTVGYDPNVPTVRTNLYPWGTVVEPFKETVLTAGVDDSTDTFEWTITSENGDIVFSETDAGPELVYTFNAPTVQFNIAVERFDGESGEAVDSVLGEVMCKYVRREFREVSEADLAAYFDAMVVFVNTDLWEGRDMYGDKFVNSEYLGYKHSSVCIHGGLSFFTGHIAFTMELEQTLQLINPSVTEPVWNYVLDAQIYGADFATRSALFSMEQFGPVEHTAIENVNHYIEGRLAGAPMPDQDFAFAAGYPIGASVHPADDVPEANSYGILTTPLSNDPSKFATRGGSYCGLGMNFNTPGCEQLLGCLLSDNLEDLRSCTEAQMDGFVHKLLGGWFDCPYELTDLNEAFPQLEQAWGGVGKKTLELLDDMYAFGNGYVDCPASCDADTPFGDCRCVTSVSKLSELGFDNLDEVDSEGAYTMLDNQGVIKSLASDATTSTSLVLGDDGIYFWEGLTPGQNADVWIFLFKYLTNPGKIATLETQSSAADPLFWALHPILDKTLSMLRLLPMGEEFDYDWPEDDRCYGFGPDDTLPFQGLFGESPDEIHDYANTELLDLLDPTNPQLPYVYADFDFGIVDEDSNVLCYVEDDIDSLLTTLQAQKDQL